VAWGTQASEAQRFGGQFDLFNPSTWGKGYLFQGQTQQSNPYTQDWMNSAGNQQNDLSSFLFGGGENNGALAGYMQQAQGFMDKPQGPNDAFMNQFLSYAPQLQGLTRTASDAETARATQLGQEGVNNAASMYAGLGSKYGGANMLAGNQAMQASMGDLSGKIASENFALLNNLYGGSMNNLASTQESARNAGLQQGLGGLSALGQGLGNYLGIYGQNSSQLASAANPMISQNPSQWDGFLNTVGTIGNAAGNIASLATGVPNFGSMFNGLFAPKTTPQSTQSPTSMGYNGNPYMQYYGQP
jgi:hypothetical protein